MACSAAAITGLLSYSVSSKSNDNTVIGANALYNCILMSTKFQSRITVAVANVEAVFGHLELDYRRFQPSLEPALQEALLRLAWPGKFCSVGTLSAMFV